MKSDTKLEKEDDLLAERQKAIIEKIVSHLASQGSSMYYESTINICHEIHNIIHNEEFLDLKEKEDVKNLGARDIQNFLSYNSSCC